MDNPSSESSTSPLDTNQAASVFAEMLDPREPEKAIEVDTEIDAPVAEPEASTDTEPAAEPDGSKVTILVDGKTVELTPEQVAEAYKNGLRQADYTRKTMETAEQRKAADAAIQQAQIERQNYASNLQRMQAQIEGALQEQQRIDWNTLLESDPVEYLKQQHLLNQRQAALAQNQQQQRYLYEQHQAEQRVQFEQHVMSQREELLAKLPTWKDEQKAAAEREAIKSYLVKEGYSAKDLEAVTDHRAVVMARKAMLYDQMISKAQAATKKVATLPTKVERPGAGETQQVDKRSSAFNRLSKSGRVEDAAAVFSSIL